MECQITDRHFLQRRGKVAQVRTLCPFLAFHSNHGLLCACSARAWVADANCTLGLREAFREQSIFGRQERRQCACRAGAKQCTTQRCKCRKAGVLCTSCCRSSMTCVKKKWCCRYLVKLLNRFALSLLAAAQHLHYWFKFRKAGFLCTSQCHPLMTCQQIKKAPFQLMSFSSENGKNKVVATRECKHSRTTKSLQKVPIVALAFHVMPRKPLYSDDFSQIPILPWPLPSNT